MVGCSGRLPSWVCPVEVLQPFLGSKGERPPPPQFWGRYRPPPPELKTRLPLGWWGLLAGPILKHINSLLLEGQQQTMKYYTISGKPLAPSHANCKGGFKAPN